MSIRLQTCIIVFIFFTCFYILLHCITFESKEKKSPLDFLSHFLSKGLYLNWWFKEIWQPSEAWTNAGDFNNLTDAPWISVTFPHCCLLQKVWQGHKVLTKYKIIHFDPKSINGLIWSTRSESWSCVRTLGLFWWHYHPFLIWSCRPFLHSPRQGVHICSKMCFKDFIILLLDVPSTTPQPTQTHAQAHTHCFWVSSAVLEGMDRWCLDESGGKNSMKCCEEYNLKHAQQIRLMHSAIHVGVN